MAVIKANAYGHGLIEVARALESTDCFAVARFAEAERLRAAGIRTDIVVMGGPLAATDLDRAVDLDCRIVIHDPVQVSWVERFKSSLPGVWVKVDTGMRRLGIYPGHIAEVVVRIDGSSGFHGLLTLFS